MNRLISDSIIELDFTFPTLECFYNYMHEYRREFNTGYYKIKNITYEKCENSIFPDQVIMTQITDEKYIPPCRRTYTEEEWIDDADKIDAKFGRHAYKCPKCGKYANYFVSGTEVWWDRIKPNFCPNCGMKGG